MKKLIILLFIAFAISCGNPYDKFKTKENTDEPTEENTSWLFKFIWVPLGLTITLYGKHYLLDRYRKEMHKYHHIPTDPPKDGRLEITFNSSAEKGTSEEIITEINNEQAAEGKKSFIYYILGSHKMKKRK